MTFRPSHMGAIDPLIVLVVDDDENTVQLLKLTLEREGAHVLSATSGPVALRLTFERHPGVILLDVKMPEMDGLTACQRLRALSDVPIIMMTALSGIDTITAAFAAGADDYVLKPFATADLLARLQICLGRKAKVSQNADNLLLAGADLVIDSRRHSVYVRGKEVYLTSTEFRLLVYMARHPGQVLSHQILMAAIRGEGSEEDHRSLKRFVGALRRKIEPDVRHPRWLLSKRGVGYMLAVD